MRMLFFVEGAFEREDVGAYPVRPLPAPSSTLSKEHVSSQIFFLLGKQLVDYRKSLERTNIVLPCSSSILFWSRYSARTIPAGQSCPPHSETSVCSLRGGLRRPLKFSVTICDCCSVREGTRSSETERWEKASDGSVAIGAMIETVRIRPGA